MSKIQLGVRLAGENACHLSSFQACQGLRLIENYERLDLAAPYPIYKAGVPMFTPVWSIHFMRLAFISASPPPSSYASGLWLPGHRSYEYFSIYH
jgi:hypothetical protein